MYRYKLFLEREWVLYPIVTRPKYRRALAERIKRYMRRQVRKTEYHAALEPDYELGCKRILISDDFLASLNRENVELVTEPIERITATGIATRGGRTRDFDAIVYATGFDLEGHSLSIETRGEGGVSLRDAWKDGTEAYRGVMIPGFPNFFSVTGPNTGVGTTSVVFMIEQTVGWIVRCIRAAGADRVVRVAGDASDAYNRKIQRAFADTVWTTGCKSWYRKPDGRIETLYPYHARAFRRQMRRIDERHVEFRRHALRPCAVASAVAPVERSP